MGQEIERKFLVNLQLWQPPVAGMLMRQGYLPVTQCRSVRVRIQAEQAYLTIKGPAQNHIRLEFEYPIPLTDAETMLTQLCQGGLIEKIRYPMPYQGKLWEVDEFLGDNQGLLVAEVELEHADEAVVLPPWVGQEVTDDPRYLNVNLAEHPYSRWQTYLA